MFQANRNKQLTPESLRQICHLDLRAFAYLCCASVEGKIINSTRLLKGTLRKHKIKGLASYFTS